MVVTDIIYSALKKSVLVIVVGLLIFYTILAIALKKPNYPGLVIYALFIVWVICALCVLISVVVVIALIIISVSIKICIHEPHSSGVFARGIKKYYDKDIEYFDSVHICGVWICCDVWKEGGVKCIEDNK